MDDSEKIVHNRTTTYRVKKKSVLYFAFPALSIFSTKKKPRLQLLFCFFSFVFTINN